MLKHLVHKPFLNCKEATFYMELKQANQLNFIQKLRLTVHLYICKICRTYQHKTKIIHQLLENEINQPKDNLDENQINQLKNRIKEKLTP